MTQRCIRIKQTPNETYKNETKEVGAVSLKRELQASAPQYATIVTYLLTYLLTEDPHGQTGRDGRERTWPKRTVSGRTIVSLWLSNPAQKADGKCSEKKKTVVSRLKRVSSSWVLLLGMVLGLFFGTS